MSRTHVGKCGRFYSRTSFETKEAKAENPQPTSADYVLITRRWNPYIENECICFLVTRELSLANSKTGGYSQVQKQICVAQVRKQIWVAQVRKRIWVAQVRKNTYHVCCMARSLRSLRQVATLRHGHMARRSALLRSCISSTRNMWT